MTDDKVRCDGTLHRAVLEFVTFTEIPDSHSSAIVEGTIESVRETVAEMKSEVSSNTSVYVDWCCDACKEVTNG